MFSGFCLQRTVVLVSAFSLQRTAVLVFCYMLLSMFSDFCLQLTAVLVSCYLFANDCCSCFLLSVRRGLVSLLSAFRLENMLKSYL